MMLEYCVEYGNLRDNHSLEGAPRALRSRKYEFKPVAELKDGKRAQQPPQDTPSTTSTPSTPCTAQRVRFTCNSSRF